ncbi:EAL and modified HD-GYP domain-containing signal transduction protein [Noviherbaspirillum humi]|uniref:EAL and modified HD-GYP domain-containing signal transduction protein n=1 Tax=Noviherbaspirillum humi TaxID=1688639 RepID=A0A239FUT4_9BURK|nr:HDOD domain-containing protein [Noviherbaspirillum humi]SNS60589.1 EAL and modified HD-GYP domain-containing signal transduction protein [Noviherbaspirillum humi]
MQELPVLIREPLLDKQENVLGYELLPRRGAGTARPVDSEAMSLLELFAGHVDAAPAPIDSLLDGQLLFVPAVRSLLKLGAFEGLPVRGTVLAVHAADLQDAQAVAALKQLREAGCGISLRGGGLEGMDKATLAFFSHVELSVDAEDFEFQLARFQSLGSSSTRLVARGIVDWMHFDACARLDLAIFPGALHLQQRPDAKAEPLNPAQRMILQLMDMVRKNAEPNKLEAVLKRDAALAFKLLRYINSAGFGLGCEIQSLRHAVSLLGYASLYRWLSVLLASAGGKSLSPAVLQTAVIRGRFVELLGREMLPKSEGENLFVAGMFSLLDRMLGVPMATLLQQIDLAQPIGEALLSRTGIYGPFLALAEACEQDERLARERADALCIAPRQINQAHISALAWAQSIKFN